MSASHQENLAECFRLQVIEKPHRFAVRSSAERLTYAELDMRASALAGTLAAGGFAQGSLAGILLDRSAAAVISFLAVLKAGGAFVPLDPASPAEVITGLACRHRLACIISNEATIRRFPGLSAVAPLIDAAAAPVGPPRSAGVQAHEIAGSEPACVMFTSGSTGEPKGAVIPHRAIVRLVKNPGYMPFTDDQVFLQSSPLGFDASLFEVWGALLNGAELVIPEAGLLTLDAIAAAILRDGVTTLFLTSGLFNLMVDQKPEALRKLRYLIAGGDVMSPRHAAKAARLLSPRHFIVAYGPTENTTFTTTFAAPPDLPDDAPVPIGWPIAGTVLRILDENMRAVPDGSPGQLYAGGTGLALGYLDAPDLTEQKFVADPEAPSQRLYRTGDLVWRDGTGLLHFAGRADNQIKVNGYRIEPEHVEIALRRHLPVTDIAVIPCAMANGGKHLVAFIVSSPGAPLSPAAFREIASKHLPPHMVPSRLEPIDAFPLTRTGKIDRLALRRLAEAGREHHPAPGTQEAAPIEAALSDVWRRHLELETVDIEQNFFDLGGTSLQLLGVHAELERLFPGLLSIQDLFDLPTIRLLRDRICGTQKTDVAAQAAARAALQQRARQSRGPSPATLYPNSEAAN
jgi:amino acid adenylation domain-containing protein